VVSVVDVPSGLEHAGCEVLKTWVLADLFWVAQLWQHYVQVVQAATKCTHPHGVEIRRRLEPRLNAAGNVRVQHHHVDAVEFFTAKSRKKGPFEMALPPLRPNSWYA
jgi:hypothetical protein